MVRSHSADRAAAANGLGEWLGSARMEPYSLSLVPGAVLVGAGLLLGVPWFRSLLLGNGLSWVGLLLLGMVLLAFGLILLARRQRWQRTSGHVQWYAGGVVLPKPGGWLAIPDAALRVLVEGTFDPDGSSPDAVPISLRCGREAWNPVDVSDGVRQLLMRASWRAQEVQRPLVMAAFDRGEPVRFDGLVVSVHGLQNGEGQVRRWREIDGLVLEPDGSLVLRHQGLGSETFAQAREVSNLPLAMELISRARGQATI